VYVPTGAWLLIGVGSALVIVTLLLVFIIPSGRRRRPPSLTPRRLRMPSIKVPAASPAGSMLKGFSYLYAPLKYPRVHYSVGGRVQRAIARVDAVDPSVAPERVGQALHQMVDLDSGTTESPASADEPVVDILDQPRNEEPT
jgi:hypothetical protein